MYYFGCICKCNYRLPQRTGTVVHKSMIACDSFNRQRYLQILQARDICLHSHTAPYFRRLLISKPLLSYPVYWPVYPQNRQLSRRAPGPRSLYHVLEVDPKATQKEIKSAYYKLSMTYHPDKNRGSDSAALKFHEITEAYDILGNYLSRRKYDRGMIAIDIGGVTHQEETTASHHSTYEQAQSFKRPFKSRTAASGRSAIYNFDEWTQLHYGNTFAKQQEHKRRQNMRMAQDIETSGQKNVEYLLAFIVCTLVTSYGIFWTMSASYDIVQSTPDEQPEK